MGNAGQQRPKLRGRDRRQQILMELQLRPHVRISDLSHRFRVSTETVRRDLEKLSTDGLLDRAHGGASARATGPFSDADDGSDAQYAARERIGRRAAQLVQPGETLMVDAGATTWQFARHLALAGTPCTVLTNSFAVALALGKAGAVQVVVCPGDYLATETAVVGSDTLEFIARHSVDRCLIGAWGLDAIGPSATLRDFAAIKRAMLRQSTQAHVLIDRGKFGRSGLARAGNLTDITSIVCDGAPDDALARSLARAKVGVVLAGARPQE